MDSSMAVTHGRPLGVAKEIQFGQWEHRHIPVRRGGLFRPFGDRVQFSGSTRREQPQKSWASRLAPLLALSAFALVPASSAVAQGGETNPPHVVASDVASSAVLPLTTELQQVQTANPDLKLTLLKDDILQVVFPAGNHLYIEVDQSRRETTVQSYWKVGGVNEAPCHTEGQPGCLEGVSHFVEHLLFEGTETYPGQDQIKRRLDFLGVQQNAYTSLDQTGYFQRFLPEHLDEVFKIHASMMTESIFLPESVYSERGAILQELGQRGGATAVFSEEFLKLRYGEHPYSKGPGGPEWNIMRVGRDDIVQHYQHWYQPGNLFSYVGGPVDVAHVINLAREGFDPDRFPKLPEGFTAVDPGQTVLPDAPQLKIYENPALQGLEGAQLQMAMKAPPYSNLKDVLAMHIALRILGGTADSRLDQTLQYGPEKMVDSVGAGLSLLRYDSSAMFSAKFPVANFEKVRDEIMFQIQRMRAGDISQAELDLMKEILVKSNKTSSGSLTSSGQSIGRVLTGGGDGHIYTDDDQVLASITLDDVKRVVRDYWDGSGITFVAELPPGARELGTAESETLSAIQGITEDQSMLVSATADVTDLGYTKMELNNGATLIANPNPGAETVSLKIFIPGSITTEKIPGTVAILRRVAARGTTNRDGLDIAKEESRNVYSASIDATEDYVVINATAVREDLGELLWLVADMVNNPKLDPNDIAAITSQFARGVQRQYQVSPAAVAYEEMKTNLFPNHRYGRSSGELLGALPQLIADDDEGNAVKLDAYRRQLLDHHQEYFVPKNMVISVAGGFNAADLANRLETMFPASMNERSTLTGNPLDTIPAATPLRRSQTITTEMQMRAPQVVVLRGWHAPPLDDADMVAGKVLNAILSGGLGSNILGRELRGGEEGLVYSVGASYSAGRGTGTVLIQTQLLPQNKEKVLAKLDEIIKRITTEKVDDWDLARAKNQIATGFELNHDSGASVAETLGRLETMGLGAEHDAEFVAKVNAVTADDILRVAQRIFSSPSVTSIVEPAK